MDPEEELGLAALMGDREVPLVGGDQAAARGPTSGPEDTPAVSEWVPAREPVSDHTRAPSVLSSLEPAERAAVTAIWVRHSGGPLFHRSATKGRIGGNRRLGPLDWTNCYFLILYFMDFPLFLLL